jgi:hypothetical protein
MIDQSIFFYHNEQYVNIFCEIYSYPKSILQLTLNNQIIDRNETIDCFNDDLSTILLSDLSCLSQINWRIRVRINIAINLSKEHDQHNLTCLVSDFSYGNSWKYSKRIQFIQIKGQISSKERRI